MSDDGDKVPPARPVAICRSHDELVDALARCSAHQGVTRQEMDAEAALPDGFAAKLLSPRKGAKAIRGFTHTTLWPVLEVLGLEIVLQYRSEAVVRNLPQNDAHGDAYERAPARQDWRRKRDSAWGRRYAAMRMLTTTPKQRTEIARKAAQARWRCQSGASSSG